MLIASINPKWNPVRTLNPLHGPARGVGGPTPPLIAVAVQHPSSRSTPATAKQHVRVRARNQHFSTRRRHIAYPQATHACRRLSTYPQATAWTRPPGRHPTPPLIEPAARHCPTPLVPPGTREGEATHTTSASEPEISTLAAAEARSPRRCTDQPRGVGTQRCPLIASSS
ncbi:hypothetical protein B0H14DRAFT_3453178 [Mycena olivaceomarginata]|nr:hypothetical protein B0H14DRAFT_3453178 [Mycena olivaceomarginata]